MKRAKVFETLHQPKWDTIDFRTRGPYDRDDSYRVAFGAANLGNRRLTNLQRAETLTLWSGEMFEIQRVAFAVSNAEALTFLKTCQWALVVGTYDLLTQLFWNTTEHGWDHGILGDTPWDGYILSFELPHPPTVSVRQNTVIRVEQFDTTAALAGPIVVLLDGDEKREVF